MWNATIFRSAVAFKWWLNAAQWDSDNQQELRKLMEAWPFVTSNKLGQTAVVKHHISALDKIPGKLSMYRVSPVKKNIIENHVDKMLQDGMIEPSSSPWW